MSQEFNSGAGTNRPEVIAVVRTGHDVKIKEGYENDDVLNRIKAITERRRTKVPQMPSCHVLMSDGLGISMINAGVSAPNVVNIADLIAPKRSMLWAMAGHSAGLSRTQKIGDYVYGDSYFVNPMMPNLTGTGFDYSTIMPLSCPTSSEFQRAIEKSVGRHASEIDIDVGDIYTRAALVSTDYRIWERFVKTRQGLQEVRAATLEMETAYLALKANEQSIPYGAFLKVSDIPHFDKPKTTASADGFFEDIGSHLGLIIEAIEVVKAEYADDLASRKFRPRQGPGLFVAR
jgi:AMP nucleosidase